MRVYEGGARREYEETLRSIGAAVDEVALRESLVVEVQDGFFAQGLGLEQSSRTRTAGGAIAVRRELTFFDADINDQINAGGRRRGSDHVAGRLERAFRAIGRYVDSVNGHGVLILEQDEELLLRLTSGNEAVVPNRLVAFSRNDLLRMMGQTERDRR